ncbi:hypothetical protein MRX96_032751 [Rhipicephalus microplus]
MGLQRFTTCGSRSIWASSAIFLACNDPDVLKQIPVVVNIMLCPHTICPIIQYPPIATGDAWSRGACFTVQTKADGGSCFDTQNQSTVIGSSSIPDSSSPANPETFVAAVLSDVAPCRIHCGRALLRGGVPWYGHVRLAVPPNLFAADEQGAPVHGSLRAPSDLDS